MTKRFKTVSSMGDLLQFGINPLTGEACAFSMRVLCDLNEDGVALMADFLGSAPESFAQNWNTTVGEKPAVASMMLTRGIVKDLATFAFFREGALATMTTVSGDIVGVFEAKLLKEYEKFVADTTGQSPKISVHRNPVASTSAPHVGSRNVHAATHRVM